MWSTIKRNVTNVLEVIMTPLSSNSTNENQHIQLEPVTQTSSGNHPEPILDSRPSLNNPIQDTIQEDNSIPVDIQSNEFAQSTPNNMMVNASTSDLAEDDMARDLGERVMEAINAWRSKYHLEKVPDKIVLSQAINILYIMEKALK